MKKYLLALLTLLSLTSCSSSQVKSKGQEITVNIEAEPNVLDPRKAIYISDYNVIHTFSEGLYRLGKDGDAEPALAKETKISEDGTTYTIKLRESFWSNGDPLTAHDFIYAWKCILDKDFAAPAAHFFYCIKNAKEIKEGTLPSSLFGAVALDDYTIEIELVRPTPYFTDLLKNTAYLPVHRRLAQEEKPYATSVDTLVSSGPFVMTEWKSKDVIVLEKNPYYWNADAVKLNKLSFVMVDENTALSMVQNGELDWAGAPNSTLPIDSIDTLKNEGLIEKTPLLASYWIRVNTEKEELKSPSVRRSLAMAINRTEICKHILHGEGNPATGIVPALMGLQDKPYFEDGDVSAAQSLLAKSGKKKLNLKLSFANYPNYKKMAEVIQDQWKSSLGANITLDPQDPKVFLDNVYKGNYDLAVGRWVADMKDPVTFLQNYTSKNHGPNSTGWESSQYVEAFEKSFYETGALRRKALQETEQIIMNDMPVIPVYNHVMLHLKNEKLKGVNLSQTSIIDFSHAYLEN